MGALKSTDIEPGDVIVSKNPASGDAIGEVPNLGPAEVKAAVARARSAQTAWAERSVRDRCHELKRLRDVFIHRAPELIDLIVREGGKTRTEALSMEVMVTIDLATYFIKRAPKILAPEQ